MAKFRHTFISVLAVSGLAVAFAATASASSPSTTSSPSDSEQHCVVQSDEDGGGMECFDDSAAALAVAEDGGAERAAEPSVEPHCVVLSDEDGGDISCFDDFAAAISAATGGRVDVSGSTVSALRDAELDQLLTPVAPQATYVHAILWTGMSATGSSLTFTSSKVCGTSYSGVWTYFQSPWNNNFESGHTYSGCKMRLYDGYTASGSPSYLIGIDSMVNTFKSFNNQASSARSCGSSLSCV